MGNVEDFFVVYSSGLDTEPGNTTHPLLYFLWSASRVPITFFFSF